MTSKVLASTQGEDFVGRPLLLRLLTEASDALTEYEKATMYCEETVSLYSKYGLLQGSKEARYMLSKLVRRSGNPYRAREILNEAHQEWSDSDKDWTGDGEYYEGLDAFDNGDMSKARQNFSAALPFLIDMDAISSHAYLLEIDRREGLLTLEKIKEFIERLDTFGQDSVLHTDVEPKCPLYRECVARGWFAERFTPFTQPLPAM